MLGRQKMPEQDPAVRKSNFNEVALGFTEEQAVKEAKRCLQCKKPSCMKGCPVEVKIPAFLDRVAKGDFDSAIKEIKVDNALPAICGRVCPQETQCEQACVLSKKGASVSIGRLERFLADYERKRGAEIPTLPKPTGKKVAVVGSGPAGLTAAADLAKMGHSVTIFEALHEAGGVLIYGIPEFRLPKDIVSAEVEYVKKLGVNVLLDSVIGKIDTVDELLSEFDAVFLGTGAGLPAFLNIDGENLNGVYSANEFLTRVNLMKSYKFPEYDTPVKKGKRVVVVGGGNVAMDSARCALRLGAEEVTIVYRRGEEEMPARAEEIEHAREEGIKFRLLTNPVRIVGDGKNWVTHIECINMHLCEPDESGRCKPAPTPGTEHMIEADVVVIAVGTSPNPLVPRTTKGLEVSKHGTVIAKEDGATTKEGVYAGGDAVTGSATVISAMGAGKKAARAIDAYLKGK
ncbi:NADPH-dependent glutamate synthase [Candidatus Methanoperedens nitratireducens]|uniref:Sulfide dehydrogenase subunit alpha n=1 Tax=Candidatus Methanoperedens nitratireducens TaxID=1392998 RepID=A0A284VT63_9EURY|nr:NADPH-dependent glutamate synthase [Candidatus Methanoperedens nitroreducens]SNQ62399.1 Sulfide dehydrogenase subunit alpha [Candidatus Methanoperedens nitroreducens]